MKCRIGGKFPKLPLAGRRSQHIRITVVIWEMSFCNVGRNVEPNVKHRCDCEELCRKWPRKLLRIRPEIFVFDPDLFSPPIRPVCCHVVLKVCPHRCPFLAQSQRGYQGFRVWFGIRACGGAPDMAGEFLKLSLAGPIRPTRPILPANKQTKMQDGAQHAGHLALQCR